jgi:hypothetical protein
MSNKLKNLKLDLLLKELKLLDSEKQYNDEFTSYYKPIFMDELGKNGYKPNIQTGETTTNAIGSKQKKVIEVGDEELKTIKSVFRSIAKICHPDKTKNIYRIKLYEEAQFAYEINDLLTLYKISKKLNIEVELNTQTLYLLEKIITDKKKELKDIESSFLWLWVNEEDEEKKLSLIKQFINKHNKK